MNRIRNETNGVNWHRQNCKHRIQPEAQHLTAYEFASRLLGARIPFNERLNVKQNILKNENQTTVNNALIIIKGIWRTI